MNINAVLKKENITNINKLSTLQTNMISNSIAAKLCAAFPEHDFDKQNLFVLLSRLSMHTADLPNTGSMAKYVSHNKSIYFSNELNVDEIATISIHECLHFIQEYNAEEKLSFRMGLADYSARHIASAINEAAVQLMASEANQEKEDIVTYYNLTLPTISPSYYTLECTLMKQIAYFIGTYPLYQSTINSNDIFKNTFIQKTNKRTYINVVKNFNNLVDLQEDLSTLTNDLQNSNDKVSKIKNLNKMISNKKDDIFNLFLKTQNIIMTACFNNEFKHIRNIEELKAFKSRVYNYQYIIGKNSKYTFYTDFFHYTMKKIEQKESYLEENGYIFLPGDSETAIMLFEEKSSIFSKLALAFKKLKKVTSLKKVSTTNQINN